MVSLIVAAVAFVVVSAIVAVTQYIWDYREIRDGLKA